MGIAIAIFVAYEPHQRRAAPPPDETQGKAGAEKMVDNGGDIIVRGGRPDSQIEISPNAVKEIGEIGPPIDMVAEDLEVRRAVERFLSGMDQRLIQIEDEQGPIEVWRFPVH